MWNLFKVNNKDTRTTSMNVVLVSLLLTTKRFHTLHLCFHCCYEQVHTGWESFIDCWLWTGTCHMQPCFEWSQWPRVRWVRLNSSWKFTAINELIKWVVNKNENLLRWKFFSANLLKYKKDIIIKSETTN